MKNNRKVLIAAVLFLMLASAGGAAYAKYYAQSAQAGIAIASGVYFSSNYLGAAAEENTYLESVVSDEYGGGAYTISLEIRNYENNLLYNSINREIPYSLSVWLEDSTVLSPDITYTLTDLQGGSHVLRQGKANATVLNNQILSGGQALSNKYLIEIEVPANHYNDDPPAVYAAAGTEQDSPVNRRLQGKLILQKASASAFIESSNFIFPSLTEGAGEAEKWEQAKSLGALTYEIRTVSDSRISVENLAELKISWQADKLEIDRFGTNDWVIETGEDGWKYTKISAIPYSAIQITFFKRDNLQGINNLTALEGMVMVEHVQQLP